MPFPAAADLAEAAVPLPKVLRQDGRPAVKETVEPDRMEQHAPLSTPLPPFDAASFHLNFPPVLQPFESQACVGFGLGSFQARLSVANPC